jgi:hypothetical protein
LQRFYFRSKQHDSAIFQGFLLAVLEKVGVIEAFDGGVAKNLSAGTVAAGWQNFIICIEMFFAAIALRFAFPYSVYVNCARAGVASTTGRVVTMQSISSNLKETMNPQDIMHDAIHNFHPQYKNYTQYNPQVSQRYVCFVLSILIASLQT